MHPKGFPLFLSTLILASAAMAQDSTQGLYKIYSNLGKKGDCFYWREGWLVGGGQYDAMPFTPKADAKVTEIQIALFNCEFGCGTDVATVSLNRDSGGLPGNAIHAWTLHKLGTSKWHSCPMTTAKSKKGISLKKGKQYWLVAEAPYGTTDSWAYTYNLIRGNWAYEENNGGWLPTFDYLSAFGVFGIKLQ